MKAIISSVTPSRATITSSDLAHTSSGLSSFNEASHRQILRLITLLTFLSEWTALGLKRSLKCLIC